MMTIGDELEQRGGVQRSKGDSQSNIPINKQQIDGISKLILNINDQIRREEFQRPKANSQSDDVYEIVCMPDQIDIVPGKQTDLVRTYRRTVAEGACNRGGEEQASQSNEVYEIMSGICKKWAILSESLGLVLPQDLQANVMYAEENSWADRTGYDETLAMLEVWNTFSPTKRENLRAVEKVKYRNDKHTSTYGELEVKGGVMGRSYEEFMREAEEEGRHIYEVAEGETLSAFSKHERLEVKRPYHDRERRVMKGVEDDQGDTFKQYIIESCEFTAGGHFEQSVINKTTFAGRKKTAYRFKQSMIMNAEFITGGTFHCDNTAFINTTFAEGDFHFSSSPIFKGYTIFTGGRYTLNFTRPSSVEDHIRVEEPAIINGVKVSIGCYTMSDIKQLIEKGSGLYGEDDLSSRSHANQDQSGDRFDPYRSNIAILDGDFNLET